MINKVLNDVVPSFIAGSAVFTRLVTWLMSIDLNSVIVTISGIVGLIYLLMKVYHQYLLTKEKKKEIKAS